MKMKKVMSLVLALSMALSLTACGGSGEQAAAPAAEPEAAAPAESEAAPAEDDAAAPAETEAAAEATGADVSGKTVVFIPKVTGNAFFEAANDGAQKYAADWGITVDYQGSATAGVADQVQVIN